MSMMMSMTMPMSDVATSTMSGMAMASSTGSMDMPSSHTSMMGMDNMAMAFFTSTATPLFSMTWTPKSAGEYAGTCIFLIALAVIFRALLAVRSNLFQILGMVGRRRKEDTAFGYANGSASSIRPWRASEAVWIASIDVLVAGVGYLLMVAVMTMNVGYFLSILGGVFLGSLIMGRFVADSAAH